MSGFFYTFYKNQYFCYAWDTNVYTNAGLVYR